jgi:hypothetical protein
MPPNLGQFLRISYEDAGRTRECQQELSLEASSPREERPFCLAPMHGRSIG